ncbi:MAG: bifunctional lysine ketoglutarate reductase /saccharopine dehydrogenase family protein [Polyangiaceae bacterium]
MSVGIRREDKHQWEARTPLTPDGVRALVALGVPVVVQPSTIRAYSDEAYCQAGAVVQEDLSEVNALFAVKEIPHELLREGGTYVFFSHTIKGQKQNMPLLKSMMQLGCTLIDYERIVDDDGRRLVFFGRHAGVAGMIDTLSVLGRRLKAQGIETALSDIELAHEYEDLGAAKAVIRAVGERLEVPRSLAPLLIGFAGYGNVSQGAQSILDLLPVEVVDPSDLPALTSQTDAPRDRVFKVVFEEEHLAERTDGSAFELQHYYEQPQAYRAIFQRHLVHLSVLVNAIYWTERYPRLVRKDLLKEEGLSRLLLIGDISCDIEGSVECTVKATTPGLPCYIYDHTTGKVTDGYEGDGLAMMTTDCLPCELPRESSSSFTEALAPFVAPIAAIDDSGSFEDAGLPAPVAEATILWRGELTPPYRYLVDHVGDLHER